MTSLTQQGTRQIKAVFEKDTAAFMPYFTLGYPDMQTSIEVVKACVENGADLMELGVPFSDPLADGPTIQHSTQIALDNGVTVAACLTAVRTLRADGVSIPLILMGYYNPILAYGVEKFVTEAAEVGVSGFIVPDLPPEEAAEMLGYCERESLGLVFLLAPNSTDERIKIVLEHTHTFTYLVSVMGITGERTSVADSTVAFIEDVRSKTEKPLAVGFGISTPDQAQAISKLADGVIVGSALIKIVRESENKPAAAGDFVAQMVAAVAGK